MRKKPPLSLSLSLSTPPPLFFADLGVVEKVDAGVASALHDLRRGEDVDLVAERDPGAEREDRDLFFLSFIFFSCFFCPVARNEEEGRETRVEATGVRFRRRRRPGGGGGGKGSRSSRPDSSSPRRKPMPAPSLPFLSLLHSLFLSPSPLSQWPRAPS